MKKKLLSLLMAATMVGSMAGATTVFAEEADTTETTEAEATTGGGTSDSLEDVSEPVTLSLMVTTRPSTDKKDFYLDLLPELVHERFPNITIWKNELFPFPEKQYHHYCNQCTSFAYFLLYGRICNCKIKRKTGKLFPDLLPGWYDCICTDVHHSYV